MEFPRMVYRAGTAWVLEAGRFDLRTVADATELEAAQADGWHLDQYAARDAAAAEKAAMVQTNEPDDDAPPTRAELLQKAEELGITVDGRWGDKKIAAAIAEKLKG